ncbi:MAG: HAMP domain-containing sensor histidine kinase [Flavobacteriales bacterium]
MILSKHFESERKSIILSYLVILINLTQLTDDFTAASILLFPIEKSSSATSIIMMSLAFVQILYQYQALKTLRIFIKSVVYLISGITLMLYLVNPESIYQIPFFESVSWSTALIFMVISALMIRRFQYSRISTYEEQPGEFQTGFASSVFRFSTIVPVVVMVLLSVFSWSQSIDKIQLLSISIGILCLIPFAFGFVLIKEFNVWHKLDYETQKQLWVQNKKLTQSNQILKKNSDLLEEYARITSHNLRGPVHGISRLTEIITDLKLSASQRKEAMELLVNAVQSHESSINGLSEFHEMILNNKPEYDDCDLHKLIQRTVESCEVEYGIVAQLNLKLETRIVSYPAVYLESLIYNLTSNAFRYRSKERNLEIGISLNKTAQETIIIFSDNGKGIDLKRFGDQIFKYGRTFHKHQDSKGLGLFMTKAQLNRLGDEIEVSSTVNVGTTFVVTINNKHAAEQEYVGSATRLN